MDKWEMEDRTRAFALGIVRFVAKMPKDRMSDVLGRQLLRAATSVGANYHEANRAESRSDFHHKIALVEKEASETCYWLKLCQEAPLGEPTECAHLLQEADQLLAMFTVVGKKTRPASSQIKEPIPHEFI